MKALLDGDILRYEVGYAAETGWRSITERDDPPPFDYVENLLNEKIANICAVTGADSYCLYLSSGENFRVEIAKTKPYKGTRVEKKPWHFANLTAYMTGVLPNKVITYLEADDAMAIDHLNTEEPTIICSRDKDLRQIPGMFYSWELGRQPSFGPIEIAELGHLELSEDRKNLKGSGYAFFCAQMLLGDTVDNIPGVKGCGPVKAHDVLYGALYQDFDPYTALQNVTEEQYQECYGNDWEEMLDEQGKLLWIVRRLNDDGSPVLWERGMYY